MTSLQPSRVLETVCGPVQGFVHTTPESFETEVFLGIPYAQPPILDLRFEKPVPPTPWRKVFSATKFGLPCITHPDRFALDGEEDCLTLNVYRPNRDVQEKLPVMVFIHGGGFVSGSTREYRFEETVRFLVPRGVVVASMNYRLGPYGFFTTGDMNIPGNYGLWDVVEALRFVKASVSNFGGDAENITLFGHSAGGGATSFLSLTDETKDLFARSIPMSGSCAAQWANSPEVVRFSKQLTEALGCDWRSFRLRDELLEKSAQEVKDAMKTFMEDMLRLDEVNLLHWSPNLDGDLLKAKMIGELLTKKDDRPVMLGLVSQESAMFIMNPAPGMLKSGKFTWIDPVLAGDLKRDQFVEFVESRLALETLFGADHRDYVEEVVSFYEKTFASQYPEHTYLQLLTQLFSDLTFNVAALREARKRAAAGQKVYFYLYSYVPKEAAHPLVQGAAHATELVHFLNLSFMQNVTWTPELMRVRDTFLDLFVNFARTGRPFVGGLELEPVTEERVPYIDINVESTLGEDLWPERVRFWDEQAKKYGFDWILGRETQQAML